jgi:hypothetical protein
MKKSERMEEFVAGLRVAGSPSAFDPCYLGYFECFNQGRYYEAHDVLEHLWLKDGRKAPDYRFYKGLIQLAGGFVHLKLQRENSAHPKHGVRMWPARRLFLLAIGNLTPYAPYHRGLDLAFPLELAAGFVSAIEEGGFERNPWDPEHLPVLPLPEEDV